MKGPRDAEIDTTEKKAPVAGGKALQRFELFHRSRGLGEPAAAAAATTAVSGPVKAYAAAIAALHSRARTRGGRKWRFLGPSLIYNGQTYGSSRVVVSGRVSAVAVDPSNRRRILAGSAAGGVWQSLDHGTTWHPRTDEMPTLTIGAVAFDPSHPRVVYAGTGEGNWYAWLGQGILRSRDGGRTWALTVGAPFVGQGFYDLIVDPSDGRHILAATNGGLYESKNAGTTWTQRRNRRTWTVSILAPGGPVAEVLAACGDGLFQSNNGGTTWAAVALPGAPAGWDRLAAKHAPSNPAVAYAFGASGGTAYLWRRSGGAWTSVTLPAIGTNQAWYDWFVGPAPDTDRRVYLGAIDAYRGNLSGATWSWTDISTKAAGASSIHPDQHAIGFDPTAPDTIYVGNDGGLFRSEDRGDNWVSLNNGLGITEVEYVAEDPTSTAWLLAGTQDNGSMRYTGTTAWEHVADGDGGDCGVNAANPDICFHSYYYMGLERSTTKGLWGSFSWIGPPIAGAYATLFYPPMAADGDTIAQAGQSVFVSRDSGTTWTEVTLPAGLIASALAIPDSDHVYAGMTNGRIFRTDWTAGGWSAATELTKPRPAWISCIYVDRANLNRIWATSTQIGGGRVFRSDNAGDTWRDCSPGLPPLPINSVAVDNRHPKIVWVGADVGVYESRNAGLTWHHFSHGLPNVLVEDLRFHARSRRLRAGTRNRGVWEVAVGRR
jgi:photosystem II stability/assembly factor-like uncharacterized protein